MTFQNSHRLFNGLLVIIAVFAWSAFVMGRPKSKSSMADIEELVGMGLPPKLLNLQVWIGDADAEQIRILPTFQPGDQIQVGEAEMLQINLVMQMSQHLRSAQRANGSALWRRLGEIRFSTTSGAEPFVIPLYQVGSDGIGFEWQANRYQSSLSVSEDLLGAFLKQP